MTRTSPKTLAAETPARSGGTFLERALERALLSLDRDAGLSDVEREAAKSALAAALACEIRDVLTGSGSGAAAARALTAAMSRPFARAAGVARPGYFREPSAVVGVSGEGADVRLTGGTATWLRLMPAHDPGRTWTAAALRTAMRGRGRRALPIFGDGKGTGELSAGDGFGVYAKSPSATESSGVVFAFCSGEVWSVDTYVQDALSQQQPNRAILPLEPELTAAFSAYVELLERLGAPKPYRWIIGMDGLMGRSMALPDDDEELDGLLRGDCVVNTVVTEGEYDGAESAEDAIAPFFADLRRACSTPVS
jgi:hypothetical protein